MIQHTSLYTLTPDKSAVDESCQPLQESLRRRATRAVGAVWLLVGCLLVGPNLGATPTSPVLAVGSAKAFRGETGILLEVRGDFPYVDLVQHPYPLQVFVRERTSGTRYVLFSLPDGAGEGDTPVVIGGIDQNNVWEAMWAAQPTAAARLLLLAPDRLEVLLPPSFPDGPAEVQLFVIYQGQPVFSNAGLFSISASGGGP